MEHQFNKYWIRRNALKHKVVWKCEKRRGIILLIFTTIITLQKMLQQWQYTIFIYIFPKLILLPTVFRKFSAVRRSESEPPPHPFTSYWLTDYECKAQSLWIQSRWCNSSVCKILTILPRMKVHFKPLVSSKTLPSMKSPSVEVTPFCCGPTVHDLIFQQTALNGPIPPVLISY